VASTKRLFAAAAIFFAGAFIALRAAETPFSPEEWILGVGLAISGFFVAVWSFL
jgi:hypothetical protein